MNSHKTLLAMITAALAVSGCANACAPSAAIKSVAAPKETAHTIVRKAAKAGDFYEAIDIIVSGYNAKKIVLDPAYGSELKKALLAILTDESSTIHAEELAAGCDVLAKGSFYHEAKKCRELLAARSGSSVRRPRHASAAAVNDDAADDALDASVAGSLIDQSAAADAADAALNRSVIDADAAADAAVFDDSAANSEASVSAHVASPLAVAARQARAGGAAAAVSDTVRAPNAQVARLAQLRQENAALNARLARVNRNAAASASAAAPAAPAPLTKEQAEAQAAIEHNRIEAVGARINALAQGSTDHQAILAIATDLRNCATSNLSYPVEQNGAPAGNRSTAQMVGIWTRALIQKIGASAVSQEYVNAINQTTFDVSLAHQKLEAIVQAAQTFIAQANASAAAASAAAAPAAPAGARDLMSFVRANPNPRGSHRAPSAPAAAAK